MARKTERETLFNNMFQALPTSIKKHSFYHNGAYAPSQQIRQLRLRESMNALPSLKIVLGYDSLSELPTVIWQDNTGRTKLTLLDDFQATKQISDLLSLGDRRKSSKTATRQKTSAAYPTFLTDPLPGYGQQVTIDLQSKKTPYLYRRRLLTLRLYSSTNKGLRQPNLELEARNTSSNEVAHENELKTS